MEENNLLNESNINKTDNIINNFNKGIEILSKRGKREKHFLQENGDIIATMYSDDVHFEKNGSFEEIDNSLVKVENYYRNKNNSFKVYFNETNNVNLMGYELLDGNLNISVLNSNNVQIQIVESETKFNQVVKYENIFDGIDFEYDVTPTKVKENVIIKNKDSIVNELNFIYNTNLELKLNENGSINAIKNNETLFVLDAPYIKDAKGDICTNTYYQLEKIDTGYKIKLQLDYNWLNNDSVEYPVVIDPTITTNTEGNVYDTYIYPNDNNVDRNKQNVLKAGVERLNGKDIINRTLVKFDLPKIGTGSQICNAYLNMMCYPTTSGKYNWRYIDAHRITVDWNEETANWQTMNDKYDERIESVTYIPRNLFGENNTLATKFAGNWDITALVKKWYSDEPNYGMMIKSHTEKYIDEDFPAFFSKNNDVVGYNPKPLLEVVYRNQNGIENYMSYKSQTFSGGCVYENIYNGNIVGIFNVGETIGGSLPVSLDLIYNTNDVVLDNNYGFGIGYKFNAQQIIKKKLIGTINYLEYLDEDGTIHYFINEDGAYHDEDNLNMTIHDKDNEYILKNSEGMTMHFTKTKEIGYLTKIEDSAGNIISIFLDSNNRIIKLTDSNEQELNIAYENDLITVISPNKTVVLNYNDGILKKISDIDGSIIFEHNDEKIISRIIDKNGTSIGYEYYSQKPYRIKKVIEYGQDSGIGASIDIIYDNKTTTIVDNKGNATTFNFNESGSLISTCDMKNKNDVNNAYATVSRCFDYDQYKNRIFSNEIPVKHVKNYLTDISFENEQHLFNSGENIDVAISSDCYHSGLKSLKIESLEPNKFTDRIVEIPKGFYYTFSAYIKNNCKTQISLSYINNDGEIIEAISPIIKKSLDFERQDITIYYPAEAVSNLFIKIYLVDNGIVYLDDIQLEEGEVANNFNYVENSDFSKGLNEWTLSSEDNNLNRFTIANLENDVHALKIEMDPECSTSAQRVFNISGEEGDLYNLSFWYKNKGIVPLYYNSATIGFNLIEENEWGTCIEPTPLNPNEDSWQYFSASFSAPAKYDKIFVTLFQETDANELYITNLSIFKGITSTNYDYYDNGNIKTIIGNNGEISELQYDKNNALVNSKNPKGNNITFECDNLVTKRILNGMSEMGLFNTYKYDINGNPIFTKVHKKGFDILSDSKECSIRFKGTEKYVASTGYFINLMDSCMAHNKWILESESDLYKFKHPILTNKYLSVTDNGTLALTNYSNRSLFELIKNDDKSYVIKSKVLNKYIKNNSGILELSELYGDDVNFHFYLEDLEYQYFIQSDSEYTDDKRFVKSTIDTNFHKINYEIDSITGLTNAITNEKGVKTIYEYDDKQRLISFSIGNRKVSYNYNGENILKKIIHGDKEYVFDYDEFLNMTSVKIGNSINLITNEYFDNNGGLKQSIYGNNQKISYTYDSFDRVATINKMDNLYRFKYGNHGDLLKVISNDNTIKYSYDIGRRLTNYNNGIFNANYKYDLNNNVIKIKYNLDEIDETLNNTFNKDDKIIETIFDNNKIQYLYDGLRRIKSRIINDSFITNYKYITNGKRTSLLVQDIDNNGDVYSYTYDSLDNLTHVYHNGKLENEYSYDIYNELVQENNYLTNETIRYNYDNSGNILFKKVYEINSDNIKSQDIFEYGNYNWNDQLTKYNNDSIIYDQIGNPIKIGDSILLSWINGRQLQSYNDNNNNITYTYNLNGVRTSKCVNGIKTDYYLDKNDIIFEKTDNNIIYYLYNDVDDLIGFKYNNQLYYYVKNNQEDIIQILDSNLNIVANYKYDSWGNIISITNAIGEDVSGNENHIANINPFRYRSYYYDKEIKMYYLISRYYNPKWGRFINADNYISTDSGFLGYNMYLYCNNDYINETDDEGHFLGVVFLTVAIVVGREVYKKVKKNNANKKATAKKQIKQNQKNKNNTKDGTKKINQQLKSSTAYIKKNVAKSNPISKATQFANLVKTGGVYDLKNQKEWQEPLLYNGIVMDPQDIGNFHYGYIGRAAGYSTEVLVMAGGLVQLKEHGIHTIDNCITESFCDDMRDTYFIKMGALQYDKDYAGK